MNTEDIIRMAREAGARGHHNPDCWDVFLMQPENLERFAALVAAEYERQRKAAGRYEDGYRAGAAAEREECAKLCLETEPFYGVMFAEAIRARGQL